MRTVKATEDTAGVVLATRLPGGQLFHAIPLKSNWLLLTRNGLQAVLATA